ncbi:hypothetical protein RCH14_003271 [Massilia sp. MP_M2]|uniref:vanadium-dependent haloperoxidase n=1 Tax=Massilia sp. MP_M2 TaxID=3071713 RepID=UPI00319E904A
MFMHRILAIAALITCPAVRADVIVDWNVRANATMVAEGPKVVGNPFAMSRTLAIMHIAMSDAINACDPTVTTYLADLPKPPDASSLAAAHAAARTVLVALYPRQVGDIDPLYLAGLAALPDDVAKVSGVQIGMQIARRMLARREDDGIFGSTDTYQPATSPGMYVPTSLPVASNVASRKPFLMRDYSQFRPGPPPLLRSALWARDFHETHEWGAANSARCDALQTETARFWEQLGPPAWSQVTRVLSTTRPLPLAERARAFALLNLAMFDSYVAVVDAKYHYRFWRPITAIRNGDLDDNPLTERDASWKALIDTPPHPEYPCAHCAADGAAGIVLRSIHGAGAVPFTVTFAAMPGVERTCTRIQQMQNDIAMARIWGGVHFRNSNEVGEALGAKVGTYVLGATLLRSGQQAQR